MSLNHYIIVYKVATMKEIALVLWGILSTAYLSSKITIADGDGTVS